MPLHTTKDLAKKAWHIAEREAERRHSNNNSGEGYFDEEVVTLFNQSLQELLGKK